MSKEIDLDFERETEKDREEEKQYDSDYEHLNDKINAIDDRVTELENNGEENISATARNNVKSFSNTNLNNHRF